jgi:small subunit ribosomal protein S2e
MAEQPQPAQPAQPAAQSQGPPKDRGFGRGGDNKKGGKRPERKKDEVEWKPVTKLGRLVKSKLIENLVDIFRFSIPIKESEIVDTFLGSSLKEEVMEVKSVQKQTQAGQRTRFKAYAIVGDEKNFIGLGWKCHKEVQGAIKGAVIMAKLNIIPVRKGYWGNKIGAIHTVPCKVTGKSGSVKVRLVPAPRGTGLVSPPVTKKLFNFAGIKDIYTKTEGSTRTRGNFVKAAFAAIKAAYEYNSPDFWGKSLISDHPYIVHRQFLESDKFKN